MEMVIVTGLSGSGKSIALHTLEDQGFYCIDNLPLFLLPSLGNELADKRDALFTRTAVGIDARNQHDALNNLPRLIRKLKEGGIAIETVFLEADQDVLIRRYSETRRWHPLSSQERSLAEAISHEKHLMQEIRTAASVVIDTSRTNQHQLRDQIRERIGGGRPGGISVLFQSFGFKHGVPRDADFVYDLRCLPNPHWDRELRPLTGRDQAVKDFLNSHQQVVSYRDSIVTFLENWIPSFAADARSYLTVALGCTGGQHRSVHMAEDLSEHFRNLGFNAQLRHRELT
jgi:UPF0042 nucleotide-binding protein